MCPPGTLWSREKTLCRVIDSGEKSDHVLSSLECLSISNVNERLELVNLKQPVVLTCSSLLLQALKVLPGEHFLVIVAGGLVCAAIPIHTP